MTRVSACDGRYLSLAQQKRAWEELNRIFGGQTPTPGPDPPTPVVSDWSVYCSGQPAQIAEILQDRDVQARLVTVEYHEGEMSEPVNIPVFTLYGSPDEFVLLVTEIEHTVDLQAALCVCGMFRGGEFIQQYAHAIPSTEHFNKKLLIEMFSCDGMGIVTYLTNYTPEGEIGSQLWSQTYSYDWAEGEMPGVCFFGFTANPIGMPMAVYHGTLSFAVLKAEV